MLVYRVVSVSLWQFQTRADNSFPKIWFVINIENSRKMKGHETRPSECREKKSIDNIGCQKLNLSDVLPSPWNNILCLLVWQSQTSLQHHTYSESCLASFCLFSCLSCSHAYRHHLVCKNRKCDMCIISYQEVFALINDWSVRWFTAMSLRYVCTCTICFLRLPIWGSLKYTAGAFCWINWNWTNQFSRIEDWNTKYSFSTSLCNKIMSLASWTLWLGELIAHIKPCYDYCFLLYIYI